MGRSCMSRDEDRLSKPASHIRMFVLDENFQEDFDQWAAEVEEELDGKLDVVLREVIQDETRLLVFARIVRFESGNANRARYFKLGPDYQAEFDQWANDVEKKHEGTLEIVSHEFVRSPDDSTGMVIFWRVAQAQAEVDYDGDMPKVDAASRIKKFNLGLNFQAEFDQWAEEVEKKHGGDLEIVFQESIMDQGTTMGVVIYWRIAPRAHVAKRRR